MFILFFCLVFLVLECMANVFFFLVPKCMANVLFCFFSPCPCYCGEYNLQCSRQQSTSSTALEAILAHFWLALPTRLPMFLIPQLPDAYHAAPR